MQRSFSRPMPAPPVRDLPADTSFANIAAVSAAAISIIILGSTVLYFWRKHIYSARNAKSRIDGKHPFSVTATVGAAPSDNGASCKATAECSPCVGVNIDELSMQLDLDQAQQETCPDTDTETWRILARFFP